MKSWQKIIFILSLVASLFFSATTFFLWQKIKSFEPVVYYQISPEKTFIYSEKESIYGIEDYLKELSDKEMDRLIREKKDFVYGNLKEMKITLYQKGEEFKSFPIMAKGADWLWGKTPPGLYYPDFRSRLHFSSVARVWMPYAIRYWGNYFIHGWPYDLSGRPLRSNVSGGCIRLSTKDAKEVFEFVKLGETPILIFDEEIKEPLISLISKEKNIPLPSIEAEFLLAADLDTGEILLDKEGGSEIFAGPAAKIALALAATESVNLEKRITAKDWMFAGEKEGILIPGRQYTGNELLKILLSQSSNEALMVLTRFLTPEKFLILMNEKVKGLGLKDTFFVDVKGQSPENKTTLYEIAKIMRYIKDYREFILEFIKNVKGDYLGQGKSAITVWEMSHQNEIITKKEPNRFIFIGIFNSANIEGDLKNISEWLENNFELKKIET